MLQIDESAIYDKNDLSEMFGRTTRTINRFYNEGLPKRALRGKNYTFGYEILEWIKNDCQKTAPPVNQKLEKFRTHNF